MKNEVRSMNREKGQAPTPIEDKTSLKRISFLRRMYLLSRFTVKKKKSVGHNPQLVSGQAMLLTVMLLTGVILSTASLAALITLYQMRQASDVASSNQSIFAADAGIECALYKKNKEGKSNEDIAQECSQISFGNKAEVKVVAEGDLIRSAGKSKRSARAFEVTGFSPLPPSEQPPPEAPPGQLLPLPPPPGQPPGLGATWNGDFETGNTIQYSFGSASPGGAGGYQCKTSDGSRGRVVSRSAGYPVRLGNYSSRQHVEPGDNNVAGSNQGERCDILRSGIGAEEGNEMWYAWSTYFPSDYNPTPGSGWNLFADWHNSGSGQANQNFEYNTSRNPAVLEVRTYGGCQNCNVRTWTLGTLTKNQWYDFVQHIKWSSDSNVGFLEMWINGQNVVPFTRMATLYTGQGAYLKLANYRAPGGAASTIFHDEARAGRTRADVEIR